MYYIRVDCEGAVQGICPLSTGPGRGSVGISPYPLVPEEVTRDGQREEVRDKDKRVMFIG